MTSMTLQTISPTEARELMQRGARLIDIREADEYARQHIPDAQNVPLSALSELEVNAAPAVIFHCRSGARTAANKAQLARAATCATYLIDGGLDAWRSAGLPIVVDRRQPLELMRQVQLAAGGLVLIGVALGFLVAPAFFGLSAFVGAGLMFAGATGWCGMARLLALMPWNRRAHPA
jgi:rhodanese-related sulfurtransferase